MVVFVVGGCVVFDVYDSFDWWVVAGSSSGLDSDLVCCVVILYLLVVSGFGVGYCLLMFNVG